MNIAIDSCSNCPTLNSRELVNVTLRNVRHRHSPITGSRVGTRVIREAARDREWEPGPGVIREEARDPAGALEVVHDITCHEGLLNRLLGSGTSSSHVTRLKPLVSGKQHA